MLLPPENPDPLPRDWRAMAILFVLGAAFLLLSLWIGCGPAPQPPAFGGVWL